MRNFFKTRGSAIVLVIGAITVLSILVFSLIRTNTNRSFSTRFMSNEKKAEAVVESASDLMLGYIKNQMNLKGSDFYYYLRMPAPVQGGKLWATSGENYQLDVSDIKDLLPEFDPDYTGLEPIKALIANLGEENVDLKLRVRIAQAEGFTSDIGNYEVAGVTNEVKQPRGKSAKFLDSINQTYDTDGSLSSSNWAPSAWVADFNLPSKTNSDTKNFKISVTKKIFGISITIKVKVRLVITKLSPGVAYATVSVTSPVSMPNVYEKTFDFNEILKDSFIDIGDEPLSIEGIRRFTMEESDTAVAAISYQASKLKNEINNEYSNLQNFVDNDLVKPDNFSSADLRIVEKGGLLEVTSQVDYYPHGKDNTGKVSKILVSTIPFKVSDVQPIAPEYSLFVSASDKLSEGLSSMSGSKVNLDGNVGGCFSVHSVPKGNYSAITGFNFGATDDLQVPGMVRINSSSKLYTNTFVGTPSEPYLTEFNIMTSPKVNTTFMNIPVFQWRGDTVERYHEFDFPVLFDPAPDMNPIMPLGLRGVEIFFKSGGLAIMKSPTLLLGSCHMEYPLGISIEAPLNMNYANAAITVKPSADVDLDEMSNEPPEDFDLESFEAAAESGELDDYESLISENATINGVTENSRVYVDYENKNLPFGMLGYSAYNSTSEYNPEVPANFPPNCYSLIQYAKKATYFYDSFNEFLTRHSKHPDDSTAYFLNGVVYIKSGIEINDELRLKGKGILVCKNDINFNANVVRIGEDSVVSLIARGGAMYFNDGCTKVEAACYSNLAPVTSTANKVEIHGNLVANEFDRNQVLNLEIFFDSKSCRTSPLSVIRDVGKFAPSRYWVSMPDNWASFKYEKK